jgi:hypothetical protein
MVRFNALAIFSTPFFSLASVFKGATFQFVPCQDIAYMAVDRFCDWAGPVALPFEIRCRYTPDK